MTMLLPFFPGPAKRRIVKPHDTRRNLRTGADSWNIIWWVDSVKPYHLPVVAVRPILKDSGDTLICEHLEAKKMLVTDREGRTRFKPIIRPSGISVSDWHLLPVGESASLLAHPMSHLCIRTPDRVSA